MKIASFVLERLQWTSFSLAMVFALIMMMSFAMAQSSDSRAKSNLQALKSDQSSERVVAARALIEDWQSSLAVLIKELSVFNREVSKLSEKELSNFRAITDVLRSIVLNKEGAVQEFRKQDDDQTIRSLAWAARSEEDRDLRINATYILASVTDNTNLCIILHHLRDKEIKPDGRINLLQVANAVASYAYSENIAAIRATADSVERNIEGKKDVDRTRELLTALRQRADKSINKGESLPGDLAKYCKDYAYNDPLTR